MHVQRVCWTLWLALVVAGGSGKPNENVSCLPACMEDREYLTRALAVSGGWPPPLCLGVKNTRKHLVSAEQTVHLCWAYFLRMQERISVRAATLQEMWKQRTGNAIVHYRLP